MAVVDSSALIPLARTGRLDLLAVTVDDIRTTEAVRNEVLTAGKPGVAALETFLEDVPIHAPPPNAASVAELEGITAADASVILIADDRDERLVSNDKALNEVARSHGVECRWVTSLLLEATADGQMSPAAATSALYDLVDEGMNLHPKVYTRVRRALEELGE